MLLDFKMIMFRRSKVTNNISQMDAFMEGKYIRAK